MSKRITPDEVKEFHRLYAIHGSYAEVARRTGRSANAIAKYIKMEKMPQSFGHAVRQTITK